MRGEEFVFEIVEGVVIELKLALQRPICHPLTLTEEVNDVIKDGIKVHRAPSCQCGGDSGPMATRLSKGKHVLEVP
jgi:hypothetical protein